MYIELPIYTFLINTALYYINLRVYIKKIISSFDLDLVIRRGIVLRRRILFLGILFGGLESGVFSLEVEKLEYEEGLCVIRESISEWNLPWFNKYHVIAFVVNRLYIIYISEPWKNTVHELKCWSLLLSIIPASRSLFHASSHSHVSLAKFDPGRTYLRAIGWYIVCWVGYGFNLTDFCQSHTNIPHEETSLSHPPSPVFFLCPFLSFSCVLVVVQWNRYPRPFLRFSSQIMSGSWQSYFTKKIIIEN